MISCTKFVNQGKGSMYYWPFDCHCHSKINCQSWN